MIKAHQSPTDTSLSLQARKSSESFWKPSLRKSLAIGATALLTSGSIEASPRIKDQYLSAGGYDALVFDLSGTKGSADQDRIVSLSFAGSKNIRWTVGKDGKALVKLPGDLCVHRCTLHTIQGHTYKFFIQVRGWSNDALKRFTFVPKGTRSGFEVIQHV